MDEVDFRCPDCKGNIIKVENSMYAKIVIQVEKLEIISEIVDQDNNLSSMESIKRGKISFAK